MKKLLITVLLIVYSTTAGFTAGQQEGTEQGPSKARNESEATEQVQQPAKQSENRSEGQSGPQSAEYPKVVHVSYVRSPFNLPAILMKKRGTLAAAFEEVGVKVQYHEITSGAKQAQAMAAGSLDIGGVMNTTSVILARSGGNHVRIVSGFSRPANMFSIVVKDHSIKSIQDLAGKKVAGPKGTVLHQLLSAALASEGMDMQQVEFLQMGLPQASTALLAGHIDAALLAGSLVIKAQKSGTRVLTTAEGLVSPKLVIAARGSFVDSYPSLVERYTQVHTDSVAWMENHLEEAIRIGAEEQGISPDEARQLYEWTEFTTTLTSEDLRTMREDIAFMHAHDLLQGKIEPESFIVESAIN